MLRAFGRKRRSDVGGSGGGVRRGRGRAPATLVRGPEKSSDLHGKSQDDLKALWREYFNVPPPAYRRGFLIRGLAQRIQELTFGGLAPAHQARLDAPVDDHPKGKGRKKGPSARDAALLPGTKLMREWQGTAHHVTGLAYISSQVGEGWIAVADRYEDGGFSGGNLERPALKRLLGDIERGLVDCVVVYKVDRLTRALTDFAKLADLFDKHGVSFVSVTQSFNTTTSMGRLTLNVLLSFAQYERELAGERIRDKFAASRKRGLWMGGVPPLGYDVIDRKLVVNGTEADLARLIFRRFLEIGSATRLVEELAAGGHTTKSWTTKDGKARTGGPIDKTFVYKLLNNRVYLGEAVHKSVAHPGEHDAIIDRRNWDRVQSILSENAHRRVERHVHRRHLQSGTRSQPSRSRQGWRCCGMRWACRSGSCSTTWGGTPARIPNANGLKMSCCAPPACLTAMCSPWPSRRWKF